jgi:hypothetical protein
MKNIHTLSTEKPSRLYITNDEEIKEGDYVFNLKSEYVYSIIELWEIVSYEKKIILTTDQDLIKDGVQPIDDTFLEWFVNHSKCESIEVKKEMYVPQSNGKISDGKISHEISLNKEDNTLPWYKIIIPQEEPKQENCCTPAGQIKRYVDCKGCDRKPKLETLEEVALSIIPDRSTLGWIDSFSATERIGFMKGVKLQMKRSYSEEEVLQLLLRLQQTESYDNLYEWFNQFKKK